MGNEREVQTKIGKEIQPLFDVHILANFINLIDWEGPSANGDGGRRCKHQSRTEPMPRTNNVPCETVFQLAHRITRAAWSHEDEIRRSERLQNLGVIRTEL